MQDEYVSHSLSYTTMFFLFVVNIDYDKNEDPIFGEVQSAESDYSANESDEVCNSSSFNYCLQFASWHYLSYDLT